MLLFHTYLIGLILHRLPKKYIYIFPPCWASLGNEGLGFTKIFALKSNQNVTFFIMLNSDKTATITIKLQITLKLLTTTRSIIE